jgi:hypothetical protein
MTLFRTLATVSVILLGLAASANAAAQSLGQAVNKKYQTLHESAGNARLGAEAERSRAEARAQAAEAGRQMSGVGSKPGSTGTYVVAVATDDFAVVKVPTYVLPNGVSIQVSGEFFPGEGVTCISLCPTPFAQ